MADAVIRYSWGLPLAAVIAVGGARVGLAGAVTWTVVDDALSAQLKQQRRRHREEIHTLQEALAAAPGENLELRRRLAPHDA